MAPLDKTDRFVPTDFLRFTLPATDEGHVRIDLTVSPGWSPSSHKWVLHLLTESKAAEAGFLNVAFIPATTAQVLRAAWRHLWTVEPYTPSSYHALRGYRIFGSPVAVMTGGFLILAAAVVLILMKKEKKLPALILVLLAGTMMWQLRFSADLLRFTHEHLTGYAKGNYDEAGSVYQIADIVRKAVKTTGMREEDSTVFICRDGTNYKEKILRYRSYPIRVSSQDKDAATASYALVTDRKDWSLETKIVGGTSVQTIRCGALVRIARKLADFSDGSILFALQAP